MKNLIYRALALVCLLATVISFTACQEDDTSVDSSVILYSFGPMPVLRGNDISFIGENLDKVTEIILPEGVSITEITVESANKITITVPQEATVGYVTLNYAGGSITTQTMMGYTEPYEISSISPVEDSVRAGDEITIEGDYLNNITAVVFGGGATVASTEFTSQDRYKIVVVLPAEAISGKLYVEDYDGNQLYSDQGLTVLQPTISSILPLKIKAGENLTIKGTNLDLVASVEFGGGQVAAEFVSQSATQIVVASPATMTDGAISITSMAGQVVTSGAALECVVPSALAVAAADGFKAGNTMTISGDDLDLVTTVQFNGSAAASEFTLDGLISVVIPDDATDGVITLTTAAAKSVETGDITLVKPTVTSVASTDIISGADIVVAGSDLDLVTAVSLAGADMVFVYDGDAGTITVTTSRESLSGDLIFMLANGDKIEAAKMTLTPDSIVTISSMPESAGVGDEITIEGAQFNMIESIYIGTAKVTTYSARSDSSITFTIPEVEAGVYNLTFNLTTGETESSVGTITIGAVIVYVTIWEGSYSAGSWSANLALSWDNKPAAFESIPYGATIVYHFTNVGVGGDGQFKAGNPNGWGPWDGFPANEHGVVSLEAGAESYEFAPADAVIDVMRADGMIFQGQNYDMYKISYYE
ncbi:MAG: IPT/TIG domain-containing protein [Rikenellaceae bacterium]